MGKNTKKKIQAMVMKEEGRLVAVASTEDKDRSGDIVRAAGWMLDNFKKNPVLQFAHNYNQPPVGVAKNIRVDGKKLIFEPVFHEITPLAREIKQMYEADPPIMRAFSVGFIPLEREEKDDYTEITKQELLEISAVPVPALAEALTVSKSYNEQEKKDLSSWILEQKEQIEGENDVEEQDEKEEKDETEDKVVEEKTDDTDKEDNEEAEEDAEKETEEDAEEEAEGEDISEKNSKEGEDDSSTPDKEEEDSSSTSDEDDKSDEKESQENVIEKNDKEVNCPMCGKKVEVLKDKTISALQGSQKEKEAESLKPTSKKANQPAVGGGSKSAKSREKEGAQKLLTDRVVVRALQKVSGELDDMLRVAKKLLRN